MSRITESAIEDFVIELLISQGYQYIGGPDIAPDGSKPERATFGDVILFGRLLKAIERINPHIPTEARKDAVRQLQQFSAPDLIANNEAFHRMLTEGVKVSYNKDGIERGDLVWLIDFNNPENNDFLVVNQFTVIENNINKRPDVIIFVNGLPLVAIELKNPADENATLKSAFDQIQTYKQMIPSLFIYNAFIVISDGLEAKAGTISSGFSHFMAWKSIDGKTDASHLISQIETLVKGMLNIPTLLDITRFFIVFDKTKTEDKETGLTTIKTVKKLAFYHQYFAVNKAVESVMRAASEGGDRKGGVIWHTQGSGKSLSMVFLAGKLILKLNNPTIVVITDRNDLDDQLYDTFVSSKQLLRQDPVQAQSREHLRELLSVTSGGVVFTTMQKFWPEEGNVYPMLSDRRNIVVFVDE
ncbi:MAG TPA: HsdR family type I site-specific deoxyribonuclease, partial [Fervidobacterium sp.]|nr:HsdR family type I site-specific deoxyribonuclease [Fervidobacterium sp.]